MRISATRGIALGVLIGLSWAGMATGEVEVSVTIKGDVEELIPILVQLKHMGLGDQVSDDDVLRMQVHSVTVGSLEDEPSQEATAESKQGIEGTTAPAPKPRLAMANLATDSESVRPGQAVLVSVEIEDTDRVVDTVAVNIDTPDAITKDLYDNGAHGDAKAGDGTWMRLVAIPPLTPRGEYHITVAAYDVNGEQVKIQNADGKAIPLTLTLKIQVVE